MRERCGVERVAFEGFLGSEARLALYSAGQGWIVTLVGSLLSIWHILLEHRIIEESTSCSSLTSCATPNYVSFGHLEFDANGRFITSGFPVTLAVMALCSFAAIIALLLAPEPLVDDHQEVFPGDAIAKVNREASKTKDITGGLPRVAELFEARKPKDSAEIAKIDGIVKIEGTARGKRRLLVLDTETKEEEEHLIPLNKHIIVADGDRVKKGSQLTEGPVLPHEILAVCGPEIGRAHV